MKKIVVRKTEVSSPESQPRVGIRASAPRRFQPARPQEAPSSSAGVITAIAVIIVVIVVLVAVAHHKPAPPSRATAVRPVASEKEGQKHWDALQGQTMAEWMQEHNKDNKALQERQQRIRGFRSGSTSTN